MRADDQLLSSIVLGSVSLIPNSSLRYTALGFAVAFALVYNLLSKRATRLHQLKQIIQQTEEGFGSAKSKCACPRDQLRLAEEWVQFLE
jgi:uncharacterized protein (DUF58 family)